MTPDATVKWLQAQMPDADWLAKVDPRCWEVTNALQNIYNLVNCELPDLGLRPIPCEAGVGVSLYLRNDFATQDFDELTRLVLIAHKTACRVSVASASLWHYQKNPHDFESGMIVIDSWDEIERLQGNEPPTHAGCDYRIGDQYDWRAERCGLSLVRSGPGEPWRHYQEDEDDEAPDHAPVPTDVELYPMAGILDLMIHPRSPWGTTDSTWRTVDEHPTLDMLVKRIDRMQGRRKKTRTQALLDAATAAAR